MPTIERIHHVKLPVSDLSKSLEFYTTVLGAERQPMLDHQKPDGEVYGCILKVPGFGETVLELRVNPEQASAQANFDPLTLAVKDQAALREWMQHLDELGVVHSEVLTALFAWLVVFDDPDQHRLRLYTLEQHPKTDHPSEDKRWLD